MPLVLTHKAASGYDDVPEERYHFGATYRRLLESSAGEWFVYYEPRREGGREAYVALARLGVVEPDKKREEYFYVGISDYEEFAQPVPWRDEGDPIERALMKADGSTNKGQFGRAVRELPFGEFNQIVELGFHGAYEGQPLPLPAVADGDLALVERRLVEFVVQRKVRDHAFMTNVRSAYAQTCAFTGLRVVNGGGWTEMEAAHIRPVESNGPDSVRNGLALSRTMHALFDRGFLTLSNEYEILEAKKAPLPDQLRGLLVKNRRALVPENAAQQPHRAFLEFHQQHVFKDNAA